MTADICRCRPGAGRVCDTCLAHRHPHCTRCGQARAVTDGLCAQCAAEVRDIAAKPW